MACCLRMFPAVASSCAFVWSFWIAQRPIDMITTQRIIIINPEGRGLGSLAFAPCFFVNVSLAFQVFFASVLCLVCMTVAIETLVTALIPLLRCSPALVILTCQIIGANEACIIRSLLTCSVRLRGAHQFSRLWCRSWSWCWRW